MDNDADKPEAVKSRMSIVGTEISILSAATAVKMVVASGPLGVPLPAVLSQFAAGALLFAWSLRQTRRIALGLGAWFGGAILGAAAGALIGLVLRLGHVVTAEPGWGTAWVARYSRVPVTTYQAGTTTCCRCWRAAFGDFARSTIRTLPGVKEMKVVLPLPVE